MAGEGNRSRSKGLRGEAEVAAIWRAHGFDVRGLEGEGDHTVIGPIRDIPRGATPLRNTARGMTQARLHSEVKRTETARPWAWMAQAEREAPAGAVPVVSFRRSRGKWIAMLPLEDLARLLA